MANWRKMVGLSEATNEEGERKQEKVDFGTTLLKFPGHEYQPWTLEEAVKGTQIFGATGSGKSSGSGKEIAKAFLKAGFGGLVLCAKPDERKTWEKYAEDTGQSDRLLFFDRESDLFFNPLAYESQRDKGKGGGETLNLVELIMRLHELAQNYSAQSGGGGGDEKFWTNALKRCLSRMIDLLKLAEEEISISNLRRLLSDALKADEAKEYLTLLSDLEEVEQFGQEALELGKDQELAEAQNSHDALTNKYDRLCNSNYCIECLRIAFYKMSDGEGSVASDYFLVKDYFLKEYAKLPEKTRSIIEEYFMGIVEPFMKGILKNHFSKGVHDDLRPESTYLEGKIIILDFSVKDYLLAGVLAQGIYKFIWQQAMERRVLDVDPLPVFLWVDESQYFINPDYDTLFQTTARSAGVCTVYLTQNINNYYFVMGGDQAQARARSLLANLNTLIFHANSDSETNEWASKTIGEDFVTKTLSSKTKGVETLSETQIKQHRVAPHKFTTLSTGGKTGKIKGHVEGIVFVNGKEWSMKKRSEMTGNIEDVKLNYIRTQFKQDKQ